MLKKTGSPSPASSPRGTNSPSSSQTTTATAPLSPRDALQHSVSAIRDLVRTSSKALVGKLSSRPSSTESSPRTGNQEDDAQGVTESSGIHESSHLIGIDGNGSSDAESDFSDDTDSSLSGDEEPARKKANLNSDLSDTPPVVSSLSEISLRSVQKPPYRTELQSPRIIDSTRSKFKLSTFLKELDVSFTQSAYQLFFHSKPIKTYPWHTPESYLESLQTKKSLDMTQLKDAFLFQLRILFDEHINKAYDSLNAHSDEEYQAIYQYLLEALKTITDRYLLTNYPLFIEHINQRENNLLHPQQFDYAPDELNELRKTELKIRAELLILRLRFRVEHVKPPLIRPLEELAAKLVGATANEQYSHALEKVVEALVDLQFCAHLKLPELNELPPFEYISLWQLIQLSMHLNEEEAREIAQGCIKNLYEQLDKVEDKFLFLHKQSTTPENIFLSQTSPLYQELQIIISNFSQTPDNLIDTSQLTPQLRRMIITNRLSELIIPLLINTANVGNSDNPGLIRQ